MTPLYIFLGAGIGGMLRYGSNLLLAAYSTLFVNIIGSFLMGVAMAWLLPKAENSAVLRLFLTTGILGGFTTFSAFSYEAYNYYMRGEIWSALLYVLGSFTLSIAALAFGVWLAK